MSGLVFLFALAVIVNSKVYEPLRRDVSMKQQFEEYNVFWNKTHANQAIKNARYLNFLVNAKQIADLNAKQSSAKFGFTQFSDMSFTEFKRQMMGFKPAKPLNPVPANPVGAPSQAIDWVAAGKTTPVKNQQQCGSCWAFSATETVESAMLVANQQVQLGSPQEIVDCDSNDQGCNGGDPQEALTWTTQQSPPGLDTESCYPYTAQDGTCAQSQCTPALKISTVTPIAGDEGSIYTALQGMPLSICCDAEPWQNYQGGILMAADCGTSIDHAIQLTGYSPSQGAYWIVRNSWGADWGENGFIWLQWGQNTCGITSEVTAASV